MRLKSPVMRKIAFHQIDDVYSGLDATTHNEYVTSVMRQWITNDGYAVVCTLETHNWLELRVHEGESTVTRQECRTDLPGLLRQFQVIDYDLADLVHRLTLSQSATCVNAKGRTILLQVLPGQRKFACGYPPEEMEEPLG